MSSATHAGQPNEEGWRGKGRQCCAVNRQGKRCRKDAVEGKQVCRLHGGLSPSGVASASFKNGRYSRNLPAGLKRDYEESLADPELLSLRDDIALLEARKKELIARMEQVKTPPWGTVLLLVEAAVEAPDDQKDARLKDALAAVKEGFDAVADYEATWRQLRGVIQETAKVASSEFKRLETLNGFIALSEVLTVIQTFHLFVAELTPEPDRRRKLQEFWNRLVGSRVPAETLHDVRITRAETVEAS